LPGLIDIPAVRPASLTCGYVIPAVIVIKKWRRRRRQTANFRDRYVAYGVMLWGYAYSLIIAQIGASQNKIDPSRQNTSQKPTNQPGQKQAS
jgi:hypothetical protein